ncbi:MAG: hypothetical protein A4E37_01805 [Methanoregulaceae archaeon PtaB.Bin056]|nr:MAG: hypothetical protein A4E37_01805 [Methanoregulaceae archaeon PtaB.Bin056]
MPFIKIPAQGTDSLASGPRTHVWMVISIVLLKAEFRPEARFAPGKEKAGLIVGAQELHDLVPYLLGPL